MLLEGVKLDKSLFIIALFMELTGGVNRGEFDAPRDFLGPEGCVLDVEGLHLEQNQRSPFAK